MLWESIFETGGGGGLDIPGNANSQTSEDDMSIFKKKTAYFSSVKHSKTMLLKKK